MPGSGPLPGSGRRPRTEEVMLAEEMLWEATPRSVKRLLELVESTDEKIALGAVTTHLKTTVGVLERRGGPDGSPLAPVVSLSLEELKAVARAQLEKERLPK